MIFYKAGTGALTEMIRMTDRLSLASHVIFENKKACK